MRLNAHQCPEVSNSSRMHPSKRCDNASKHCALQSSTRNWISFSDTDMERQLHPSRHLVYTIRTLSLIRQDVEKNCNRPDVRATPSSRGPYYDNYVQQKCNCSDAALIWNSVERIMESRLHSCPFERSQ
jgi:hypothetical protein